jgi:hypothetical protein
MTDELWPRFGISEKIRMVSRIDIPGGGQVVVQDGTAYVGHMDAPHGTSILDVKDPKRSHRAPGSMSNSTKNRPKMAKPSSLNSTIIQPICFASLRRSNCRMSCIFN